MSYYEMPYWTRYSFELNMTGAPGLVQESGIYIYLASINAGFPVVIITGKGKTYFIAKIIFLN